MGRFFCVVSDVLAARQKTKKNNVARKQAREVKRRDQTMPEEERPDVNAKSVIRNGIVKGVN